MKKYVLNGLKRKMVSSRVMGSVIFENNSGLCISGFVLESLPHRVRVRKYLRLFYDGLDMNILTGSVDLPGGTIDSHKRPVLEVVDRVFNTLSPFREQMAKINDAEDIIGYLSEEEGVCRFIMPANGDWDFSNTLITPSINYMWATTKIILGDFADAIVCLLQAERFIVYHLGTPPHWLVDQVASDNRSWRGGEADIVTLDRFRSLRELVINRPVQAQHLLQDRIRNRREYLGL